MTDVDEIIKRVKMGVSHKKKNIVIVVVGLMLALGQFSILFSIQSRVIWRFDGVYSGTSPWGGELTFNVPPNPIFSDYAIEVSESFTYLFQREEGNLTFYHIASNQSFFLEYYLGDSPYQSTEYESRIWNLPSGMYNITWNNDDSRPHYKLTAMSFFYPMDEIVVMVSGVVLFIGLIALIGPVVSIIKEVSS